MKGKLSIPSRFFSRIVILSFSSKEAEASAKIRAILENQGTPIGLLENFIAGTALCSNAILVTHNTKEFSRLKFVRATQAEIDNILSTVEFMWAV